MALPSRDNLLTLDYAFEGQPACFVAAKASIDLNLLDTAWQGQVFWGLSASVPPAHTSTGPLHLLRRGLHRHI